MAKRLDEATKKRLRAGRMLLAGNRPAEVAENVGVARQTVYTWKGLLDEGGIDALRAVPSRGRPAKLDTTQLEGVRSVVLQSPTEHGSGANRQPNDPSLGSGQQYASHVFQAKLAEYGMVCSMSRKGT